MLAQHTRQKKYHSEPRDSRRHPCRSPCRWWEFCHWINGDGFTPALSEKQMLSCWGTGWQPPQKNTSLLNPDTCWLNPKPVPSSSFWHDFVSTLVLFATALSRDWTQAKWDESSNKHEKKITEQPGHSLVAGQEVIGSNWKIYFLPWKITNKINSLNFISSHEKIQFWEGNKN